MHTISCLFVYCFACTYAALMEIYALHFKEASKGVHVFVHVKLMP